ncbi:MAG: tyrosyl-tRNA synthetase [Bacilli bacterium]|nr:tyrosyl-tRNA synthetase [Bacilli bacterium]
MSTELDVQLDQEVARQLKIISRGVAEIVPKGELSQKLRKSIATKTPLIVKLGVDPTGIDLTLGHTVVLQKMKQFQDLGHRVHLLIGDFTATIGDPSGKSETRKQLTREQVLENAKTYSDQVFKILDRSKTEIVYNSDWLAPFTFADVIQLTSTMTVARMLEREDFHNRFTQNLPLSIHEFFYPFMQGYDSVALKADVELGGTDQKFNILMGRMLQKEYGQPQQVCVLLPILEGLDGVQKMSKSLGNYIGINEDPVNMYGKTMSIPDSILLRYFELLTDLSLEEIEELRSGIASGSVHPRDAKMKLAWMLVARFHDGDAADRAEQHFKTVFQKGALPEDIPVVSIAAEPLSIVQLLTTNNLATSNSDARRLVQGGAVKVDGDKVDRPDQQIVPQTDMVVQAGKRKFIRLKVE